MPTKMRDRTNQLAGDVAALMPSERIAIATEATRPGQVAGMAWAQAIPIISLIIRHKAKKQAHGLPNNFVLAVTDDRLVAFGVKYAFNKVKVTNELLTLPLARATAAVKKTAIGVELNVVLANGEPFVAGVPDRQAGEQIVEMIKHRT